MSHAEQIEDARLSELSALSAKATPGEFSSWPDHYAIKVCRNGMPALTIALTSTGSGAEKANATFLAAAGNYVRGLILARQGISEEAIAAKARELCAKHCDGAEGITPCGECDAEAERGWCEDAREALSAKLALLSQEGS
ncbi:hypothetical protein LOK46_10845 [Methylobacterium sp. NMS14P]|uniref:hypothetical protein n=1 Tax=Methylobacterium sp. NMS14P TaxID=2894310 RepID=UPI00235A0C8B|nr:hypothetical protein [Methylobacterium sp. NMS14P]WCS27287.1 hypothetical protein LOK46_10845 [Methylobacterium sp. NMS14P]